MNQIFQRMSKPKGNKTASTGNGPVPRATIGRLSLYLRQLESLDERGVETTSSNQMGAALGITDAQVRRDLTYFGQFGQPGIGYQIPELIMAIRQILGTDQPWSVALVGVGHLGRALLGYRGFVKRGFQINHIFDHDSQVIGQVINGLTVSSINDLSDTVSAHRIKLAAVAVPASAAQEVADLLVESGIEGILNFAPVTLLLPDHVKLVEVNLAVQLEQLSFLVINESAMVSCSSISQAPKQDALSSNS